MLPIVGAPRPFARAAAALLGLELVALLVWGYSRQACLGGCHPGTDVGRALAFQDFPVLALVLAATAAGHGLRIHRSRGVGRK